MIVSLESAGSLTHTTRSFVVDHRNMFNNARSFNGDLSSWNVSSVTTMQ